MEKLVDLSDFRMYRFQCDCLDTNDAMDINVDEENGGKAIALVMEFNSSCFWSRVKYAFHIIRGYWNWREFIVRKEDYQSLAEIFTKEFKELP